MKKAQFANEGGHATLLVEISNALSMDDQGWAMIAPYGDFPGMALVDDGKGGFKKQQALQRIDRTAAEAMVSEFNNCSLAEKYLVGKKIFRGHPDVPGYTSRYPDKEPKGVFSELAARDNGFFGKPVFTNEGLDLTKSLRALSGRWDAEQVGEENGVKIYRPTRLISAGLTDKPNLPVQLLNEKEPEPEKEKAETPEERAERLSSLAHDSSHDAHAASRKAHKSGTAADHLAAFHAHAEASKAHVEATNAHTELKGIDTADSHTDFAEQHQALSIKHARAARKAEPDGDEGNAKDGEKAECANDKDLIAAAERTDVPLLRVDFKAQAAQMANDLATSQNALKEALKGKGEVETQLVTARTEADTAKAARDEATKQVATLTNERDLARKSYSDEHGAHIETALRMGTRFGLCTFAEQNIWRPRLTASFENELNNFLTSPRKVKVDPVTVERDGSKRTLNTPAERREFMNEAMTKVAKEQGLDAQKDYDKVFRLAAAAFPDVFGADQNPQIDYRRRSKK